MGILRILGILFIVAWLVLWLAVKVTFGAIHLLLLVGAAMLIIGLFKSATR
jgi:hypothetical protein